MNLFGLSRDALEEVATSAGLPAFRGRQIYRSIYARGVSTFDEMTDLARGLRESLAREHEMPLRVTVQPEDEGSEEND